MTKNARTIVALGAAALLIFVAAFIGVLTVLVRNAPDKDPEITAYAHGKTVTVGPYKYCDLALTDGGEIQLVDCRDGAVAELDVPDGYPLQLSLPKKIAEAPWLMTLVYQLPDGTQLPMPSGRSSYPDGALALTIPQTADVKVGDNTLHLPLIGVELGLPVPGRDDAGNDVRAVHAVWSIKTT